MFLIIWDCVKDSAIDSVKLIPFLLLTYLVMEYIEKKASAHTEKAVAKAGKSGPFIGGILGAFPQCGFSTVASNLYAGGLISVGTLLAIYLSTSDEMLPIFISESVAASTILKILAAKALLGIITGFIIDFLFVKLLHFKGKEKDIHELCEQEHCHCEDGVVKSAFKHTIRIFIYILLISFGINLIVTLIGEDALAGIIVNVPILGQLLAGVVGLIPNCAASVVITQLYLSGVLGAGAMMSGLLVSAGVGLLVLFHMNRSVKENIKIVGLLYIAGVFWGILIDLFNITF